MDVANNVCAIFKNLCNTFSLIARRTYLETLMKKSKCCIAACVSILSLAAATESYGALLAVDFGLASTPVQSGFTGMSGNVSMASKTDVIGAYSVMVQGEGFYAAGFNAGHVDPSVAALYEDYYYHNSATNGVGITLSIAGVTPNTDYDVTLWSYDEDNIFSPTPTTWGPAGSTTGTSGSMQNFADPYPTDLSFHRATIRVHSTTSTLDVFGTTTGGSGGTRLNGFELSAVPEPCAAILLAIGTAIAPSRRRLLNHQR